MKAWRLIQPKVLELQTSEAVKLEDPSEIKVKIEKADVCSTDFHLYQGSDTVRYPFILGRHGVGVVSDVYDEKSPYKKGDPVVVNPYVPCDECLFCKSGDHELCSDLGILGVNEDGLYRDFVTLDEKNVYRIPENLPLESALFTEYVALALSVLDRLDVQKGEHVAVLSAGKIGLIVAQLLAYYQAVPVLIDADAEMLEKAKELGFYYGCSSHNDPESYVFSVTGGRMCEKVVYPSSAGADINLALDLCSFNGRLCFMGFLPSVAVGDFSKVMRKHLTIVSASNGYDYFPSAINLLTNKTVAVMPLIGKTVSFDDLAEEFKTLSHNDLKYRSVIINL